MEREPLRDGIRRHLLEDILAGRLGAGDRIPLAATADAFGVSMTPLRESLVQLERDGFVRSDPGRGYRVPALEAEEVRQVYPLIWILESYALRSAPPAGETLDELERLNEQFASRTEPEAAARLDRKWHGLLLSHCRNDLLLEVLEHAKTRAARYEVVYMRETGNIEVSTRHHAEIVDRLREGNLDGAAAMLQENWRIGPKVLLPWLAARDPDQEDSATPAAGSGSAS
ncbi:MAG: GntR family transcriptional regulator [Gemmatimonadota bacterium]